MLARDADRARVAAAGPTPMSEGIEGFLDDLRSPRLGTSSTEGPGSYDRVVRALRTVAATHGPTVLAPIAEAWRGRRFDNAFARPLLLLAALRFVALGDADHPLALELLRDAEAPELEARLVLALGDPRLTPLLATRVVQTNEAGRAFAWGLPAMVLGLAHRGFHLVDLGCSAGLNLVIDRTSVPFRLGNNRVAGFDFPSPERRVGLDQAPIDARDEVEARWLEACIWPGQPERLERFTATRRVYQRPWQGDAPAPELRVHPLGDGQTRAVLEAIAGGDDRPVIAYESVVRPYLSEAERQRHDADLWAFLAGGRGRLWAVLEPSPTPSPSTPMTLTVHLVREGERLALPLAQSGYHSASCLLVPGATARVAQAWRR